MADGKPNKNSSAPPPLLEPAKFIRQYEEAHPQNVQSSRGELSEDTKPFCADLLLNNQDKNIEFNRKKRPRISSEESVFENPWQELEGGTTVHEAYSKIPGLCSSLADLISQQKGKRQSQRNGYNGFHSGRKHIGRRSGNSRRGTRGRRSNSRGRGNHIDRRDFPITFSGRR